MWEGVSMCEREVAMACVCERMVVYMCKNSMIRKYYNRKLQTNPCHREEEPHNDY